MWAYFDESGNTGTNVFDEEQPFFIIGWMAARTNFDVRAARDMSALARKIGVSHLHANQIPPDKRRTYYLDLASIARFYDVRFGFSRIEKTYLVACKLVDVLFDSVENFGVPLHWYFSRPLRMGLVFSLARVTPEELYREFWNCLFERNSTRRIALFEEVIQKLVPYSQLIEDLRVREVVASALDWATRHPETISLHLTRRHSYGHSPNIAAFTPAIMMLDNLARRWESSSVNLLHDRTSQFGTLLQEAHGRFESGTLGTGRELMLPFEGSLQFLQGSQFNVGESETSPGIQMVDAALWMLTRTDRDGAIPDEALPLHRYMLRRTYFDDMSFNTCYKSTAIAHQKIMAQPLTADDETRARIQLNEIERQRLEAIVKYESTR
ncbi:MAG: DUF3800 domain-containing protein [Proteobacteria bacterium]|nr:DUF3800 domain-containing protein [Pseudomonadota bacterium]